MIENEDMFEPSEDLIFHINILHEQMVLLPVQSLYFGYFRDTDFSIIPRLTQLTSLEISQVDIHDYSILSGLTNLCRLSIPHHEYFRDKEVCLF